MEIIRCSNMSFRYALAGVNALNNINLSINEGELCIVMGKSGAGKSTLLKLLKKEIAPAGELSGSVDVNASVGYASQNVDESIVCDRVRGELSFGPSCMNMSDDEIELLVAETASYFNLSDKLDCDVASLSGGERQLLNLAAVMIMKPQVLVLDEPTSQLDPLSAEKLISTILRLHSDFSTTIIMSEHMSGELFRLADSILLMENGRVIAKSSPAEMVSLMRSTDNEMLGDVPLAQRLFDGAGTVAQCRSRLKEMSLKSLSAPSAKDDIALKLRGICFSYDRESAVLSDLGLNVYDGRINAILGNNASGKSTLLRIMCGVLHQQHGRVKCNKKIAMLCQNPFDLFTKDRCSDEVEFGELTSFLGIDDIKDSHPFDLSGGQAQRLALAKVLSTNADILLLDEPTKALDCVLKKRLAEKLGELCNMGKTIVIASHDIDFVGEYASYVSLLSDGRIVSTGTRREFFSSLNFYTTSVSRLTDSIVSNVVSISDLKESGGMI